ncbi:MAG: hypothetical protein V4633_03655 [Pseudomonadota bacterium]
MDDEECGRAWQIQLDPDRRFRRARPGATARMSATLTIGALARRCGISRTTELYYEQAGLIKQQEFSAVTNR